MHKSITGTDTRQSVSLFDGSLADSAPDGVARRGQPPLEADNPRLVTRGYLLQSESLSPCDINPGVVVDWLSFTLPLASAEHIPGVIHELRQLFGGSEILDRGMSGYTMCLPILGGTAKVLWHPGRVEMGVHVDLPAAALHVMDNEEILGDVREFLSWLLDREAHITRLDLAIDTDKVAMSQIVAAQESGDLVSRAQDRRLIHNYRDGSQTLYIGATRSDRMVRFYDKAKQQKLEGVVWTRAEIQHRRQHAQRVAEIIVAGTVDPVAIFNACLDFREAASDTNSARRVRCEWWQSWVGSLTQRVSFSFAKVDTIVRKSLEWVESQVSPTLAMLAMADPDNIKNLLLRMVDDGFGKLDVFRRAKASKFRELGLTLA